MPLSSHNSLVDAETVNVWRFDVDARVQDGIKTARTLIAESTGQVAAHGFFEDDIRLHLSSNYQTRLERPSRSRAGIGSPFVSVSRKPDKLFLKKLFERDDVRESGLYKITIPRGRIIEIPAGFNSQGILDELLIVGDVEPHQIVRICDASVCELPVLFRVATDTFGRTVEGVEKRPVTKTNYAPWASTENYWTASVK